MRGILAPKYMIYITIAILIGISGLVFVVMAIDPMKSEHTKATALATGIALDINSLISEEKGVIETEINPDTDYYVRVIYHKAGKKEGYTVDTDGYYIVVSIEKAGRTVYGIKRIDGYPSTMGQDYARLETDIWKPKRICVVKDTNSYYPTLKESMLGC